MDSRLRAAGLLPLVPAAAIPLLFLHRSYQAHATFGPVEVFSSDVAVAVTVLAALVAGSRWGWAPLRRARTLWALAGALLALYVIACFWRPFDHTTKHLVTVSKIIEYALLAPSVVLLFRRRADVQRFLLVLVGWSVAASVWGLLQFFGLVNEFFGKRPGQREVSFLGIHDFAAFSGAALAIGLAGIALGERRRLVTVATASGVVGSILAASIFAFSGLVLAGVLAGVVGRRAGTLTTRRLFALAGIIVVVGGGVFALRTADVGPFVSLVGKGKQTAAEDQQVQTGSQRLLLSYIGLLMWKDHPVLGIGFERSTTHYGPYLPAAKRKFPQQPPRAFPAPSHQWGVQNFWVQNLADVGVVGFSLAVATFAAAFALALRAPPRVRLFGLIAGAWILVAAGTWTALGIIAGLPLDALTWLSFGLAAALVGLE